MKRTIPGYLSLLLFILINGTGGYAQFTFVHISDLHVCDNTTLGNTGNYDMDGAMFECCLRQFRAMNPKPAFVVASGDISNVGMIGTTDGMYGALTCHLFPAPISNPAPGAYFIDAALTIPIYFTTGNHEYYQLIVPPIIKNTPKYYAENVSPDSDYVITTNEAVLLFLRTDGDRPLWEDTSPLIGESKGITADQYRWLRNALRAAGNKRKIIVMHHPPVNAAGTNVDGSPFTDYIAGPDDGSILNNRDVFLNICDSNHVDVVLAGHIHQNVVANRAGNVVDNNWPDATRYVQTCEEFHGGYRIVSVDSSFVTINDPQQVNCATAAIGSITVSDYRIFPNPFSKIAVLEISATNEINIYNLSIYDIRGCEVKKISNIRNGKTLIERGNLLSGLYIYKLYNSEGLSDTGKLVINDQ